MSGAGNSSLLRFPSAASRTIIIGAIVWSALTFGPGNRVVAAEGEAADSKGSAAPTIDNRTPPAPLSTTTDRAPSASGAGAALDSELEQLSRERQSLTSARSAVIPVLESESVSTQRDILKQQLEFLVTELARRPKAQKDADHAKKSRRPARKATHAPSKPAERKIASRSTDDTAPSEGASQGAGSGMVDSIALAQTLFRTHDYPGALRAFEQARKSTSAPRDRISNKYFSAVCNRRMGHTQESMVMFREVANSRADDVLAECARWQLSMQQWREATRSRIEELRGANQVTEAGASKESGGDDSQSGNAEENSTTRE